jgi:hypothetical protein
MYSACHARHVALDGQLEEKYQKSMRDVEI